MRILSLALLLLVSLSCTRGADDEVVRQGLGVQGLAGQRAAAADRWVQTLLARRDAGEAMTPTFIGQLLDAAKQRGIARAEAAYEPAGRLVAYTGYRDFCGDLLRQYERSVDEPPAHVLAQIRYYTADAEWRMAQATP